MAAASLRCRISGHDLDDCGVCRRCGVEQSPTHQWKEGERERPCFPREICERCGATREQPDHDWETTAAGLRCTRCGLSI
jgi:hypothetical protein